MLTTIPPFPFSVRRAAASSLLALLAGCAGDDLLLPNDGAPAELRVVSGDRQSAPAGNPVEKPLVVEALDGLGRPVPGAVIVFEFVDPPAGAEIAPAAPATDAAGRASAVVKLGIPAGDQRVLARLDDPGTDLSVQFRLTALQGKGPGDGGDGDDDGEGDGGGGGGGDGDDNGGDEDGGGGSGGGGGDEGAGGGGGSPDDDGDGADRDDDRNDDKGKGKDGKGKDRNKGPGRGGDGGDRDDDDD
ncbi:hypothetical protein BH24GEM1_BH24GEM1_29590 [soil metagenome]